jgi:hypothetical protein
VRNDHNSVEKLDAVGSRGDLTIAAIKAAQRKPIELPPELALELLKLPIPGTMLGREAELLGKSHQNSKKRGRGRPLQSQPESHARLIRDERVRDLVPRLECQIKYKRPKIPTAATVARLKDGDPFTRRLLKALARWELEPAPRPPRVVYLTKLLYKDNSQGCGENERHVRRVLKRLGK